MKGKMNTKLAAKILFAVLCCICPLGTFFLGIIGPIRWGSADPMFLLLFLILPLAFIAGFCMIIFRMKSVLTRILLCIALWMVYVPLSICIMILYPLENMQADLDRGDVCYYEVDDTVLGFIPEQELWDINMKFGDAVSYSISVRIIRVQMAYQRIYDNVYFCTGHKPLPGYPAFPKAVCGNEDI